jgi:hypothetical protein
VTGVTIIAVTAALLALLNVNQSWTAGQLENNYAAPWYLVGIGLLVLGMAERSWIAIAACIAHVVVLTSYLGASWGSGWLPWEHATRPGRTDGPRAKALVLASILLLAALAEYEAAHRRDIPTAGGTRTVNS